MPARFAQQEELTNVFGKLTWDAVPWSQPIPLVAGGVVIVAVLAVLLWVVVRGHLPYLWNEWITSVDHKRIGVMYLLLALLMLLRGFIDALMMRSQQAVAFHTAGYLPPEHFDQIFSAHGTIMIFFAAMPLMIGLMNLVVPLQLGVRDVAFPTLNSTSFWLTATGALLVNLSLVVGEFARTGWLPYPPLSETTYLPGVGVGLADFGCRHDDDRHQFRHHHPQSSRARHDLYAHADVLLDGAGGQSVDHRRLSGTDRNARDAHPRPLSRLSFLHQ
jgi:hypothetical protein